MTEIKSVKENSKFVGEVNGRKIVEENCKNFVINYLTEVFNEYKQLEPTDRLTAYIKFFVDNFSYDKKLRDDILSKKSKYMDYFVEQFALGKQKEIKPFNAESFKEKEFNLARLFQEKKGVCQQFAQAFALLTLIDYVHTKDAPLSHYVGCRIEMNGKKVGHAVNAITFTGEPIIIDISSMIHCKEKDLSQPTNDFGPVYLKDYIKNLAKGGNKLLSSNSEDGNNMISYPIYANVGDYYNFLNLPTKEVLEKYKSKLTTIPIPKIASSKKTK